MRRGRWSMRAAHRRIRPDFGATGCKADTSRDPPKPSTLPHRLDCLSVQAQRGRSILRNRRNGGQCNDQQIHCLSPMRCELARTFPPACRWYRFLMFAETRGGGPAFPPPSEEVRSEAEGRVARTRTPSSGLLRFAAQTASYVGGGKLSARGAYADGSRGKRQYVSVSQLNWDRIRTIWTKAGAFFGNYRSYRVLTLVESLLRSCDDWRALIID